MQAVRAYSNNGIFVPFQPIKVADGSQAIITILDFPMNAPNVVDDSIQNDDDFEEWFSQLKKSIELSMDEELPDVYFERSNTMRPPLDFVN